MKTFFVTTMIVLLLFDANIAQAQTTQTKLNQVELLKQFVGSWQSEIAKDTTFLWETKSYGTGLECYFKIVTKGKIVTEGKQLWGYNKQVDKFIISALPKGADMMMLVVGFSSKSNFDLILYSDISHPEKVSWKIEGDFKSPDMFTETTILNNQRVKTDTYNRTK
jgi:hypothetical protein